MEPIWVHVDGVPDSVRHFLGLWIVGSLIGSTLDVDSYSLWSLGIVRVLVAMRDPTALEKDKGCLEVVALLHLNGYRFRFWREAVGYKPDPRFRPFFWKDGGDDDGSYGFEEERFDDSTADAALEAANMDVDGHPPTHTSGGTAVPVAQVALTPFNHSPMTDRGREIVARASSESPHLVASPPDVFSGYFSVSSSDLRSRTYSTTFVAFFTVHVIEHAAEGTDSVFYTDTDGVGA
jgi:hypothetical protein